MTRFSSGSAIHSYSGSVIKRYSLKEISMNKIMATAALLVATSTALAAPGWRDDSSHGRGMQRGYVSAPAYGASRYGHRDGHYVAPGYYGRAWHRGERFVPHGGRVEVLHGYGLGSGYGGARLYAPPRGAQWVRVNNDALLTAIATGVVLDVVYNLSF
jgi:Ni/Co efflux regulator RcnB